jgi:hypothetical protein
VLGGEALADVGRDVYQRQPREEIKVVRGEFAGPRVEDLKELR